MSSVGGAAGHYLTRLEALVRALRVGQGDSIDAAATLVAESIAVGRRVWAAPTSHVLHTELVMRAGGLAAVHAPGDGQDLTSPMIKQEAGVLIGDGEFEPEAGDIVLVGTNAGTDAGTVEVALVARRAGLRIVALTNLAYECWPDVVKEHPTGAVLSDLADVVVDIGGAIGDSEVTITGIPEPLGPSSGALLVAAAWAILVAAAERLAAAGTPPIVYRSVQLPGGEELFHTLRARYRATRRGTVDAPD